MDEQIVGNLPPGRLATNVMHFARTLRAAGLPVGPGHVLRALEAIEAVRIGTREEFYWTLHAVFVNRRDQRALFDQAFHIFWRNPRLLEKMMQLMLPTIEVDSGPQGDPVSRRLAEAMAPEKRPGQGESPDSDEPPPLEIDAAMTFSERELLQHQDFEDMSADEIARAKRAIRNLRLPLNKVRTRRFQSDPHGLRVDMRKTLRQSLRSGGASIDLHKRSRIERTPPLVVLCDISGSMSRYSRMMLHFLHTLTGDRERVFSFLFGTRLTNVTRYLRDKDVDVALGKCGEVVEDWSGGTRIGACLHDFNRNWSRRVLGQGALVLLITDGLDRDAAEGLASEMERLHKSCRRLIWLNPLLRYDAYAPLTAGARAMMPHVDDFHTVHNLASLEELTHLLAQSGNRPAPGLAAWRALAKEGEAA